MLSLVTPAFNEAANLEALYDRVAGTMTTLGEAWEWIVVDDHSADGTFACIRDLAARDPRVRGLRLASNSGSHMAITAGLHHARGDAAVVMAADLQDPPEVVGAMLSRWREGAQVVWATRRARPGERTHAGFAAIYYWVMRRVVGLSAIPARGADFFLLDRLVLDAFGRHAERQVSIFALISSMGFRQAFVEYDKQPRAAGRLAREQQLVLGGPLRSLQAADRASQLVARLVHARRPAGIQAVGVRVGVGAVQVADEGRREQPRAPQVVEGSLRGERRHGRPPRRRRQRQQGQQQHAAQADGQGGEDLETD